MSPEPGALQLRYANADDLPALADLASSCQGDPEHFVAYVGDDPATIVAEVEEVEDWTDATLVAEDADDRLVGWLLAERDPEMARLWWWGPFVHADRWPAAADALFEAAAAVAVGYGEQELAVDSRSSAFEEFAARHDFAPDPGSVLLHLDRGALAGAPTTVVDVEPVGPGTADAVAALHDELFVGTHTTGAALVRQADDRKPRYVATASGEVVGYVATEFQPDGSLYVDFLGVAVAHRGRGIGRRLVHQAVERGFAAGATHATLTVREANPAARALYASLGFTEQRILRPYRRGFTLP